MKRLLTAIFAFALIGVVFNSCKKDDETTSLSNSVTIQSEFTIGEETFTNPTFDLGKPADLEGYLANYGKTPITYNTIRINNEEIDLGNNIALDFDLEIYSAETGADLEASMDLQVYDNTPPVKSTGIYIYSQTITATVTKVGEVGGYIEGTYEGDFYYDKKSVLPFHVTGKFKVMRIEQPTK